MTDALGITVTKVTQMNNKIKKLVDELVVLAEMKSPSVKKTDKYKRNNRHIIPILSQSPPEREMFG
jgi:polyhydroxyalkanoate synthesis regulator phasin